MSPSSQSTLSVRQPTRGGALAAPRLVVAMQADQPSSPSSRHLLAGVDEVVLARGKARRAVRDRDGGVARLTLSLPDQRMSTVHARLRRVLGRWVVEDAGSKNGTLVNGRVRERAGLVDGDVLEVGHSFLVFRDAIDAEVTGDDAPDSGPVEVADDLATFSPSLAAQLQALARVAAAPVSVVLTGDSGTGKELVARAVHGLSGRRGAFVAVNCGALPDNLVEAELFGYRKGAFSGAVEDRPGLIRAAHGGTLLLDELGDLPAPSQAALLRVLQEREVMPVGDTRPVPVDLRVIAATHRDLEALIAAGQFRADLLARLAGLTVTLPPLRARREDLGLLISALLRRLAADPARVTFTPAAARALFGYAWPLNVRELERTLGAALALAGGAEIDLPHLPAAIREPAPAPGPSPEAPLSPADARRRAELDERLRAAAGNITTVAKEMSTTRAQIHRWAKRLGIDLAAYR